MELSKESVCEEMDKTILNFFDVLSQFYEEQERLEKYLKSGYLNMSRARYSMGNKSVGADQWDEQNMTASQKVNISEDRSFSLDEMTVCDLDTQLSDLDLKGSNERSMIRRRNVGKASSDIEHIEDVAVTKDGKTITKDGKTENISQGKENEKKKTDPLKWFGVLVPQSLRQSQRDFKTAVQIVLDIASFKTQLNALQNEYRTLLKQKENLK